MWNTPTVMESPLAHTLEKKGCSMSFISSFLLYVLVSFPVVVIKNTWTKAISWRKDFFQLRVQECGAAWQRSQGGGNLKQLVAFHLQSGSRKRRMHAVTRTLSPTFTVQDHSQGMVPPTVSSLLTSINTIKITRRPRWFLSLWHWWLILSRYALELPFPETLLECSVSCL